MKFRPLGLRPSLGPKRKKWQFELAGWEQEREEERRKALEYGTGPRRTDRIFKGQKRKHVISVFMDLMKDWRETPFENEAAMRIGFRQALCLSGYGWQRAEDEAAEIIGEVLKGHPRPNWHEGQWQYTIPRENCQRCYRPIDEEEYAKGSRFCSNECREFSRVRNAAYYELVQSWQRKIAGYHAWREAQPKRECQRPGCGKKYKPAHEDQRYCSTDCHALDRRTVERRICENPECGKEFAFENHRLGRAGLWCSIACYQKRRRVGKEFIQCACVGCENEFQPAMATQKYCSDKCRTRQRDRNKRERIKAAEAAASDHPINRIFDDAA